MKWSGIRSHLVDGSRFHDTYNVIRPLSADGAVLPGNPVSLGKRASLPKPVAGGGMGTGYQSFSRNRTGDNGTCTWFWFRGQLDCEANAHVTGPKRAIGAMGHVRTKRENEPTLSPPACLS